MPTIMQDLRYGLRMLAKNPGFAGVAILTLALGIGTNTAIFSVMNAVILRYLPVPNPQQVVYLRLNDRPSGTSETGDDSYTFSEYSFEQLRRTQHVFSDLIAFVPLSIGKVAVRYGENPEEAAGDMVSGNFFSGLGVKAERGRLLTLQDETQHASFVVLSYDYWTRRFARNPSVLGETLFVKGVPFTIVGVAAGDFTGAGVGTTTDFWIPLQNRPDLPAWGHRRSLYDTPTWWCLMMMGRLKPRVTQAQALAQLNPIFLETAYEGIGSRNPKEHSPEIYFSAARGIGDSDLSQRVLVLMMMVGLVLVIACINVSMLLVAWNSTRQREFSLRMALGAGRTRLFRQLLAESLLLVVAGAALGWLFALWSTSALAAWAELDVNMAPDRLVLFFTLGVSLVVALLFGLAPLRTAVRVPPGLALKTAAASASPRRGKYRSGQLVVAFQIALCLALLVGAGLLLRTLRNLEGANLGMRASGLLVFGITPPRTLQTDAEVVRFYETLSTRLRTLPGVESATLMQNRLGSGWSNNTNAIIDGREASPGRFSELRWNAVGPDYLHVLGASLLLGRDLTDADSAAASKVAIINQTFAQRYLAGRNPIGHHVALHAGADSPQYSIVGVAADSKYSGVTEGPTPMAYFPYPQIPGISTMHFELRTEGDPTALLPVVRQAVRGLAPDSPLLQPMTQQEQFEESFTLERLFARLSIFFGLLAALLVATGLYGTLAYRVSRRTAEIGVRMALGAQRHQVLWMVLRESLAVTGAGVVLGLPLSILGARLLSSVLFGIGPGDPLTFAGALAGMALVVVAAGMIPAWRAAKVDPLVALRYE